MNLVFDTDVLSTFGKIRRLDLLKELFPNAGFFIPPSVYNELFKARERGYEFIDLSMILKSLLAAKILTSNEVRVLITEIERKDRVTIKDRDDILTESGDND